MMTRRHALKTVTLATAGSFAAARFAQLNAQAPPGPPAVTAPTGPFQLAPLPYAYDALEPHLDAQTMQIHHDKHHAAYVANLNKAVATDDACQKKTV